MTPTNTGRPTRVVEATIDELAAALDRGAVTSVELVAHCLNRIAAYDRSGIRLNAVPVLNPDAFADAQAADARRARGERRGPLDGIPYTAKDSYQAAGLTVAAGSPAFEHLVATRDAYSIGRLRDAGAVLIGLTNMPPMANGGMQRGLYGRAESPYNADYLTAAFASGSSNGSGTATAASFAAFGLGEETWSSGRAPASNNALVAYTPSRGVISVRGNWPLVPTMDVVVPHTRSVDDLLAVLDELVADDPDPRGDFWRVQTWVDVPAASAVRPSSYRSLRDPDALAGTRLGVPRMYINRDADSPAPIETRASVIDVWEQARRGLEALGAEVVDVDFPVVSNYQRDRPGARSMVDRGLVPEEFAEREIWDLSIWSWDDFLRANGDPHLHRLADVDGALIFPHPTGALRDRYSQADDIDLADYVARAKEGVTPLDGIPTIAAGVRGLEEARRLDLEQWMDELALDAVVFPAVADVGPADADVNPQSAQIAWRNGTWVANGNLVPRHLGIPTVTVPMGTMADIGMPVGLTFAGKAYDDSRLIRYAWAFEAAGSRRTVPPRTPPLPDEREGVFAGSRVPAEGSPLPLPSPSVLVAEVRDGELIRLAITVEMPADVDAVGWEVALFVNGSRVDTSRDGSALTASADVVAADHEVHHSEWREPYGSLVVAVVRTPDGRMSGAFAVSSGPV